MKTIFAGVCLVAFVIAEPPPSNSYLPPPPANRGTGYSSGPANQNLGSIPQVIAARTLETAQELGAQGSQGFSGQRAQTNGFGRTSPQEISAGVQARYNPEEPSGYDSNASARNSLEEINAEPANYNFEYMVNDYQEGTDFGHKEERQEERAQGEYHVVLPDGRRQTVSYEADERGFKPQISYEDSEDLARSGYDSNAANLRNAGNQGYSSDHGYSGNHDNQGYSNDQGYSSDQGYTGKHGNQGYTGNHGNQGYSSDKGYPSKNGSFGNLGNSANARSNGYN